MSVQPGISARSDGEHVVIEDLEIDGGKVTLLRSSKLTGSAADRLGRELIRLGALASARTPWP